MNPITLVAGVVGLCVFFAGMWSNRRFKDIPAKARTAFWFTLLGAAYIDITLYALRGSAFVAHIGGSGPVFFTWSYTAMTVLMVAARTFVPPELVKRFVR